ncbi:hypothetical protein [Sodaliphilus pleomorphus]|nr:hypothetical protein [Sodaliphilus pleomorphus]
MSRLSDHMIASAILALALLVTACAGGDDVQPAASRLPSKCASTASIAAP